MEGLTKRFDGEGANPTKDYERFKRWSRACLTVQKAKGIPKEAHGSLIFSLVDGTALRALDAIPMDRIEEDGGEEVVFQVLGDGSLPKPLMTALAKCSTRFLTSRRRRVRARQSTQARQGRLSLLRGPREFSCQRLPGDTFFFGLLGWEPRKRLW